MNTSDERVVATVRDHRDELEAIAASDLRCAKYAKELLALAAENGGDH